nr:hypothetical protein CFP56_60726 [Quercus suber]
MLVEDSDVLPTAHRGEVRQRRSEQADESFTSLSPPNMAAAGNLDETSELQAFHTTSVRSRHTPMASGLRSLQRAHLHPTKLFNMAPAGKVDSLQDGERTHRQRQNDPLATSPPAYSAVVDTVKDKDEDDHSSIADVDSLSTPDYATLEEREQQQGGPDVAHPFAFPPPRELPAYTPPQQHLDRPLAVPQTHPAPTASFLAAYPPILLSYGIPASTWHSFLATLSSFLNAHAGQNAVFHATKIAQDYGDMHLTLGKDLVAHTETHLRSIGGAVKRGNPLGVVSSAVTWPIGLATQILGTVLQVPAALTQKPQTPRARADVYVAAANKKWFHARALHAVLVSTPELADFVAAARGKGFLAAVQERRDEPPVEQLDALRPWIADLSLTPPPADFTPRLSDPLGRPGARLRRESPRSRSESGVG